MRRRWAIIVGLVVLLAPALAGSERHLGIVVTGEVASEGVSSGEPLPLKITITNELETEIGHETFSTKPSPWNGETMNITLLDVYRDADPMSVSGERPTVDVPRMVSGMRYYRIPPGQSLVINTDASKWRARGGWIRGRYLAKVRVDNIHVDSYARASVLSDPFEFVIK